MKYDIFISYRRGGGKDIARTLKESLTSKGYNVFLDFDELKDGYFDEKIMHAIDEAPVFILVLSKGSMARCVDEEDWVRKEIEYALSKEKQIVPIDPDKEFDGFPEEMPAALREKVGQHQFSVLDTDQLFSESLDKIDKNRLSPIIRRERIKRQRWLKYSLWLVIATVIILGSYFLISYLGEKQNQKGKEYYALEQNGEPNYELAVKHFKISAALGNAAGQHNLGVSYLYGYGVEMSNEKAYKYFLKSYKHAKGKVLPLVCYHLGLMEKDGSYCGRDLDKAFSYFQQSAYLGEPYSQYELALMFYNVEDCHYNLDSAIYWFQKAAEQENAKSCFLLGSMYFFGQAVKQDAEKGLDYWKKGAQLGDPTCCNILVNAYESQGFYEEGFYYASMSAKLGDSEGLYYVGRYYFEGKGVDVNEAEGFLSLVKSAQKGNDLAMQYLQSLSSHYAIPVSLENISDNITVRLVNSSSQSTKLFLRFTRKSVLDMNFVIDNQCYLMDHGSGTRYKLLNVENCTSYPDINMVKNDDVLDFVLEFEKVPLDVESLTLVANDYDKVVQFSNLQIQYAN